jgi:hypothetical protein
MTIPSRELSEEHLVLRITTTFDNPCTCGSMHTTNKMGKGYESGKRGGRGERGGGKAPKVPASPDVIKLPALSLSWYEARSASAALQPSLGLALQLER